MPLLGLFWSLAADEAKLGTARATLDGLVIAAATAQGERLAAIERAVAETEAQIETLTEKTEGARLRLGQRDALRHSIEDLLAMEITTEGDAAAGEEGTLGPKLARAALLAECENVLASKDASTKLPDWALDAASETFARFGAVVTLRSTGDARSPEIILDISPDRVRAKGTPGLSGPGESRRNAGIHEDRHAFLWGAEAGEDTDTSKTGQRVRPGGS